MLKLNLFVKKLFKIVELSKHLKKNIALHLVRILVIKKFINQYFKNSIVNLYITSIAKLSKNSAKYNCRFYIKLFVTTKNINNNKILKIKYANNNNKSKFKKTLNLDKSF